MLITPDHLNGCFETTGAIVTWFNVKRLLHDKMLMGIYWPTQAFFSSWGIFNLWYYSSLNQPFSFWGGLVLALGNITWVVLAIYYTQPNFIKDLINEFE